ncbi:MAG: DUF4625 domain-containing protein [Bacteroides sp.]|nr:DUF4625 domain-containing protein [Bacteroides sp.]MCM1085398.1 DUF4625 domain-containing protein [Bacteroides sp.]
MIKKLLLLTLPLLMFACKDDKDMESPKIAGGETESPFNCQTILRGGTLPVSFLLTDNEELGSFNIEIHNNFDHHSHSTSAEDCPFDPDREAVNPWIHNEDTDIPAGLQSYTIDMEIAVPNDVDTGDYHFTVRVTDKAGWQSFKAVSLKMR